MSLLYVLRRFCQKTGLSRDTADEKQVALDYINEAARELYEAQDYPGSLDEVVLAVNDRASISLPSFVGIPRAMREEKIVYPWKLSSLRPRYHVSSWSDDSYKNWRDKGYSPLAVELTNTAPPKVIVPSVDCEPITVTIVGATEKSARVSESKLIDKVEIQFETAFKEYEVIKKDKVNQYDVLITDSNDNEISLIYNHELEARFRIIDVSNFPFSGGDDQTIGLEVLFKKRLYLLIKDDDEFPIVDFDDVLINKAVQLFFEDKGNVDGAVLFDKKAERTANRKALDQMKGKDVRVETIAHPHDVVFRRLARKHYFLKNY